MRSLAMLSLHTSPLQQPGTGDSGGMNVYVLELSSALARAGVECDVYTRAFSPDLAPIVTVEPGLRVHHIEAGPLLPLAKEDLHDVVPEFTEHVIARMARIARSGAPPVEAVHANYWLSGIAGHAIKHRLDLPLVSTFHTLDRVKAEMSPEEVEAEEPGRRASAEAAVIECSDALLASCTVEADQLIELYGAVPSRIEIVAPGVDHAFFSPGDPGQARRALGLDPRGPLLLFVGRIQPLKGADVGVRTLAALAERGVPDAQLVVVGGPSGPHGTAELLRLRAIATALGVGERVRFVEPQPHELLSSWYRAADVCLVPSRSESFGLVALEAAACGTPVVASAVGGLTTLIDHGRTGFLVERGDIDGFAGYTAKLLGSPLLAGEIAAAAAAEARRYTWSVAAARLRRLYAELTDRSLVECS
jgi:D-inositol-3-phosphate glycosyltransferase